MRFGMFIHWGLYAIPARGEWVMSNEKMSVQQYKKYFDEFNPTDFDAKRWASVCRQAGMKYAVLTAKHHDGFCLFDSKLTEYKSTNTRFGRDIVREFLEAFRAEGIAVGLYFSLLDWSHPDFPKYADRHHPMRGREEYCGEQIDFDNYLNFMHGQVKELVTGYGKLDLLWFDFSYDDMAGEKWRASDLISMVRKYQPNVCIDNRLEGSGEKYGSIATASPCFINRYIHIVITQTTIVLSKFPITVLNILISTALPNDTPPFKNRQTEMKKTAIVAAESEIEDNTVPMLSSNAFFAAPTPTPVK